MNLEVTEFGRERCMTSNEMCRVATLIRDKNIPAAILYSALVMTSNKAGMVACTDDELTTFCESNSELISLYLQNCAAKFHWLQ